MKAAEKMAQERQRERQRQLRAMKERQMRKKQLRRRRYRIALCLRAVVALSALTLALFIVLWGRAQLAKLFSDKKDGAELDFSGTENLDSQLNIVSIPGASSNGEATTAKNSSQRQKEDSPLDLSDPLLMLVNKDNPLPEGYEVALQVLPSGLVSVAEVLYDDLEDMLAAGKQEGLHFVVCSGYRSVERQQELLDEDVRACMASGMSYEEAYEQVTRMTMPPGCSEHSTGLALDIVALDYQLLDDGQERTAENEWLRENAWRYGFVLRYPRGQEPVTGIDYESWHFRYVGKEAAKYMYEQDLLLEEVWQS
ncbi:MAG: M15 family metallopeptidase [Lachnospiraceae bacterium]|nr:M15 family metallopeptidase [Lachnospiraceae bacterium]